MTFLQEFRLQSYYYYSTFLLPYLDLYEPLIWLFVAEIIFYYIHLIMYMVAIHLDKILCNVHQSLR